MGYPKSLVDYSDAELWLELERRKKVRKAKKCDYCGRKASAASCRYEERHKAVK